MYYCIFSGNAELFIKVLLECSQDEREDVVNTFTRTHNRDILGYCKGVTFYETQPLAVFVAQVLLLQPREAFLARYLSDAVRPGVVRETSVIQLIFMQEEDTVVELGKCFEKHCSQSIEDAITESCCNEVAEVLCGRIKNCRLYQIQVSCFKVVCILILI